MREALIRYLISRGMTRAQAETHLTRAEGASTLLPVDVARRHLVDRGLATAGTSDEEVVELAREQMPEHQRSLTVAPDTFDEDSRSVQIDLASETPCRMIDWDRWEYVDEVLLMSGFRADDVRRNTVPLLDAHARHSVDNILGSICEIEVNGTVLGARAVISENRDALLADVRAGHINAVSVGYTVYAAAYVEVGETATVEGRTFTAASRTLRIATDWSVQEGSLVPIGADPTAGTRAAAPPQTPPTGGTAMEALIRSLMARGFTRSAAEARANTLIALGEQRALEIAETMTPAEHERAENADGEGTEGTEGAEGARNPAPPAPPAGRQDPPAPIPFATAEDERARQSSIRALARTYRHAQGVQEICDGALDSGAAHDTVRLQVLEHIAQTQRSVVQVGTDHTEHTRANVQAALELRSPQLFSAGTPEQAREREERAANLRGMRCVELARYVLQQRGVAHAGDPMEIVGRAITQSGGDFASIIQNVAHNAMLQAYQLAPATYERWCGIRPMNDFKAHSLSALSQFGALEEVPEGMPIPYGTLTDKHETISLKTFGKQFSITRRALINDDMSAFTTVPARLARAARRTVNIEAVRKLLANPTLNEDSKAVFHADHANYDVTTAAVTSQATAEAVIRSLIQKLQLQTDLQSTVTLGLQPSLILAPVDVARYYVQAVAETSKADNNRSVDIAEYNLQVVTEAELQNSQNTGYSNAAAYLLADARDEAGVVLGFLDGNQDPRLEEENGWSVEGVRMKVALDFATGVADFRALTKHLNGG